MPFREQHIAHFKTLQAVKTPRIMRIVTVAILVAIVGTIGFLIYAPWVQTTSGSGVVTALNPADRQQNINALVSGRIDEWYVGDGSIVKKGDPIVRIVDNDPNLIQRLEAERAQVEIQLQAVKSGLATAEIDRDRMQELYENGLSARRDYEQALIRVDEFRGRVAQAAATLSRVDVNLSRQSMQLVEAPRDGRILSVNAGDTATAVTAGQILATFVPEEPQRVVEIFVDGRDVALIQPGADARIQFEGWPAVQFSGWPSQAIGTFAGEVVAIDPSAQANGGFRVLIAEDPEEEPWPDQRYIRFGATVRAWVLLETVPVGYEIWRQLNNFPPELPSSQTPSAGGT